MAKKKSFVRKDLRYGIHAVDSQGVRIRVTGREVYETKNSKVIKVLSADPGLEEFKPEPVNIKEILDEKKKSEKKNEETGQEETQEVETDPGEDDPRN